MEPLLQVKHLSTEFKTPNGPVRPIEDVSFSVNPGEMLGIVGESGCGKSVTSLSIMRLLPRRVGRIVQGEVLYNGRDLTKLSEDQMRRIRGGEMSMIFQDPMTSLNPVFRVGEQLIEVQRIHSKISKKAAWAKGIELLKSVGISRPEMIMKDYPHQLSGGMLQRVMIAMGLSCEPKMLIADEPTTALDVTIQAQILELMKDMQRTHGTAILLITHSLGVVAQVCDRVAVMYAGQVVELGDVATIFDHPAHPYTRGLMSCIPAPNETRERLDVIEGVVPTPSEMPKGCRFASRCKECTQECLTEAPQLWEWESGHFSRCLKHRKEA